MREGKKERERAVTVEADICLSEAARACIFFVHTCTHYSLFSFSALLCLFCVHIWAPVVSSATMGFLDNIREWDFDIDCYLNRAIPPSPLHRLPAPFSRFLGYRKETGQDVGNVCGAFWSFVGAFCGLAVVAAVFNNTESIQWHQPPALIASFVSQYQNRMYIVCCL